MRTVAFAAALCSVLSPLPVAQVQIQDPGTSYLFEIKAPVPPALHVVLHRDFDVLHHDPNVQVGDLKVVVQPGEELKRFRAITKNRATLLERGRPYRDIVASTDMPDPGYYTTAEIVQEMDAIVNAFPSIAQRVDLTTFPGAQRTHNNQSIWALKLSDNVAQNEDEPAVVIAAQHHARELNAPHMVIGAMRRLANGYASNATMRQIVDGFELWLVPCVNPDGVDYVWSNDNFWRKNRRNNGSNFGVDLNRNFPTLWGRCGASTRTSSSIYRGPSPGSEPETRTMRALIASVRPEVYIDFHSSGQEILFTYPPCATASTSIRTLLNRYINDGRARMNYATRAPSASGEAPEDHWNESGALSLLFEIGTSFQPAFTTTVAEENRVWPGLQRVLTAWKPAVRGHVRSIFQNQPIEATITFSPNQFSHGEVTRSRARDGRYGLWLPLGTWDVTWAAPGFRSVTRQVRVTNYDAPQAIEIEMVPSWTDPTLLKQGTDRIGTTTSLTYSSPGDAGLLYWIPLSQGTSPGITVGSRTIPLNADAWLAASLSAAPLLTSNLGSLPGNATATAQLNLPNIAALVGTTFYAGGITFEAGYPSGVKKWAQPVVITIRP